MTVSIKGFIVTSNSISFVMDGKTYNIQSDHPNYEKIKTAFKTKVFDQLPMLVDIPRTVSEYSAGRVTVQNGEVMYDDEPVHGVVVDRILQMMQDGFDVSPMCRFLERLMQNPSKRAVDELFSFLSKTNLPITDDGRFIAYKVVREDYMDKHSGTFLNKPGETLSMVRNKVDEDPNQTCSSGLHVCSEAYLPHFGQSREGTDRIVTCIVDPKDVVAVPRDYNDAKMRVCKYVVDEDVTDKVRKEWDQPKSAPTVKWNTVQSTASVGLTVPQAAAKLGITENAVKKRANRGVSVRWGCGDDIVDIIQ